MADNARGVSTLYDGAGNPQPGPKDQLVVTIPAPAAAGPTAIGSPTGTAFNPTPAGFPVAKAGLSAPSRFLFATEDGTLLGLNPAVDRTHAVIAVHRSGLTDPVGDVGAVYKCLALATTSAGEFLYATNFRFGQVEMFDSNFNLVKTFTDPRIPTGFAPFGIHNIGGRLFVTFAKQDNAKHDDVAGPGNGFVDVFNTNGDLLHVSDGRWIGAGCALISALCALVHSVSAGSRARRTVPARRAMLGLATAGPLGLRPRRAAAKGDGDNPPLGGGLSPSSSYFDPTIEQR